MVVVVYLIKVLASALTAFTREPSETVAGDLQPVLLLSVGDARYLNVNVNIALNYKENYSIIAVLEKKQKTHPLDRTRNLRQQKHVSYHLRNDL